MKQDLLKQATHALSESGHDQQGGRYTRERLMASLHDRRRRSNTRFAVLLPMAAIFVGSTAFAAVTGRLETMMVSALDVVGLVPKAAPWSGDVPAASPRSAAGAAGPTRKATQSPAPASAAAEPEGVPEAPQAAPGPAPVPVPDAAPEAPSTEPASERAAPASQTREPRGGSLSARTPAETDAHEVYRRAQAAHFKSHDLGEALRGYEAYLAAQPAGRFAVDARYNRALCLVRLGRQAEARAELERFAGGSYGGYRQADARRLLAALNQEQ